MSDSVAWCILAGFKITSVFSRIAYQIVESLCEFAVNILQEFICRGEKAVTSNATKKITQTKEKVRKTIHGVPPQTLKIEDRNHDGKGHNKERRARSRKMKSDTKSEDTTYVEQDASTISGQRFCFRGTDKIIEADLSEARKMTVCFDFYPIPEQSTLEHYSFPRNNGPCDPRGKTDDSLPKKSRMPPSSGQTSDLSYKSERTGIIQSVNELEIESDIKTVSEAASSTHTTEDESMESKSKDDVTSPVETYEDKCTISASVAADGKPISGVDHEDDKIKPNLKNEFEAPEGAEVVESDLETSEGIDNSYHEKLSSVSSSGKSMKDTEVVDFSPGNRDETEKRPSASQEEKGPDNSHIVSNRESFMKFVTSTATAICQKRDIEAALKKYVPPVAMGRKKVEAITTDKQVPTTSKEKKVEAIPTDKQVPTTSKEKKVEAIPTDKQVPTTSKKKNVAATPADKISTIATGKKKVEAIAMGKKQVTPVSKEKSSESAPKDKVLPDVEDKQVIPAPKEVNVESTLEDKVTPSPKEKNMDSIPKDKKVPPASEGNKQVTPAPKEKKNVESTPKGKKQVPPVPEDKKDVESTPKEKNIDSIPKDKKQVPPNPKDKKVPPASKENKPVTPAPKEKKSIPEDKVTPSSKEKNVESTPKEKVMQSSKEKNVESTPKVKVMQSSKEKNVESTPKGKKQVPPAPENKKNVEAIPKGKKQVPPALTDKNIESTPKGKKQVPPSPEQKQNIKATLTKDVPPPPKEKNVEATSTNDRQVALAHTDKKNTEIITIDKKQVLPAATGRRQVPKSAVVVADRKADTGSVAPDKRDPDSSSDDHSIQRPYKDGSGSSEASMEEPVNPKGSDDDERPESLAADDDERPESLAAEDDDERPESLAADDGGERTESPESLAADEDDGERPEIPEDDGEERPESLAADDDDGERPESLDVDGEERPESLDDDGEERPEGSEDDEERPEDPADEERPEGSAAVDNEERPEGPDDDEEERPERPDDDQERQLGCVEGAEPFSELPLEAEEGDFCQELSTDEYSPAGGKEPAGIEVSSISSEDECSVTLDYVQEKGPSIVIAPDDLLNPREPGETDSKKENVKKIGSIEKEYLQDEWDESDKIFYDHVIKREKEMGQDDPSTYIKQYSSVCEKKLKRKDENVERQSHKSYGKIIDKYDPMKEIPKYYDVINLKDAKYILEKSDIKCYSRKDGTDISEESAKVSSTESSSKTEHSKEKISSQARKTYAEMGAKPKTRRN